MENKNNINSVRRYVALALAVVGLVGLFTGLARLMLADSTVSTVLAVWRDYYLTAEADGIVIRDEQSRTVSSERAGEGGSVISVTSEVDCFVRNKLGGSYANVVESGTRVTKGDTIAVVTEEEGKAALFDERASIEDQIDYYTMLASVDTFSSFDTDSVDENIFSLLKTYSSGIADGDYSRCPALADDMERYIVYRKAVDGDRDTVDKTLAALEAKVAEINRELGALREITADIPGTYLYGADGYEQLLPYKEARSLDPDGALALMDREPADVDANVIGRIVTSPVWYVVAVFDSDEIGALVKDRTVSVVIGDTSEHYLDMSVAALNPSEDGEKTTLVLSCADMNADLASLRKVHITVNISRAMRGTRIPFTALTKKNGDLGVYVLSGNIPKFSRVEQVYAAPDLSYVIVAPYIADESVWQNTLRQFDKIIISGTVEENKAVRLRTF
ncbi:MAG: hypothetical protein K6G71_00375 [Clostridiales bacterium]|nr:hypothetical protein [Clostridiales bacterium]